MQERVLSNLCLDRYLDLFENPDVLAARFRESFIDRTISCPRSIQKNIVPRLTIELNLADTPRSTYQGQMTMVPSLTIEPNLADTPRSTYQGQTTMVPSLTIEPKIADTPRSTYQGQTTMVPSLTIEPKIADTPRSTYQGQTTMVPSLTTEPNLADISRSTCQGRTVVLGEGCVDLIFAVDTSLSVAVKGFKESIDFVATILRLFDLSLGTERVYFITYDVEVKVYFRFSNTITTAEALEIVKNAIFTGGSTSVNVAFDYIVDVILSEARNDCKIALFLLSDGQNNWGGNPETKATELKTTSNVEIYTIAIGESQKGWDSLKRIASGHDNFYAVREPGDIEKFARKAVEVPLGKHNCKRRLQ